MKRFDELIEEAMKVNTRMNPGTMAGWTYQLDRNFQNKPLRKDITVRVNDIGQTKFSKGDLVHNLPGGVFIMPADLTNYRHIVGKKFRWNDKFGVGITSSEDNLKILAQAL